MSCALLSALKSWSVPALLLAVGLAVAGLPRDRIDPEAVEAAAREPSPLCPPATRGFRLPGPGEYPHAYMPWIKSREDFIAHLTRGEDPEVVRRYSAGPEEELIAYLGEVYARSGRPSPAPPPGAGEGGSGADLAMEW